MSDEYTPTTAEVRAMYITGTPPHRVSVRQGGEEFDRWITTHDAALVARSRQVVETAVAAERERVLAEIREGIEGKFLDREVGLPSLNAVRAVLDRASGNETGSGCGECWVCIDRSGIAPMGYVLCPTCGNKRCPHAADHNLECTHSNEPGQSGSARYPAPPWMVGDETGEQS